MIYFDIFMVFLITNLIGFGGGPAIIPLVQFEVVEVHGWLCEVEFAEVLAIGNALPGPIATKMASYIGFLVGGVLGAALALIATILPSLLLMLIMMGVLLKYRESPQVKRLTVYIRPTVAVMLGTIAVHFLITSYNNIANLHLIVLTAAAYLALERLKVHPAFVIVAALAYGAAFLR